MLRIQTNLSLFATLLTFLHFASYSQQKVLQITNKNLPNVLRTMPDILILYHHSDCQYSTNYKLKFTHFYLNNPEAAQQIVGIVDCSQQSSLCKSHHISSYPTLRRQHQNQTSQQIEADIYLADLAPDYQDTDQYLTNKLTSRLKTYPNFVVVLFEQEGMPVPTSSKLRTGNLSDRVFYVSEGRLASTLGGFVNNKGGCWIYQLQPQNGQIVNYQCGDTYQSASTLNSTILKFLRNNIQKQYKVGAGAQNAGPLPAHQLDDSNHENQTILGYKQLVYWLQHYDMQLQVSTHSRISMCSYLYVWGRKCEHCSHEADMRTVKRSVDKIYSTLNQKQVLAKYKVYSYEITNNKLVVQPLVLAKIAGLNENQTNLNNNSSASVNNVMIVPNLIAMCFSTHNNRVLPDSARFQLKQMDRIIASQNIELFTRQILQSQIEYSMLTAENTIKQTNQL